MKGYYRVGEVRLVEIQCGYLIVMAKRPQVLFWGVLKKRRRAWLCILCSKAVFYSVTGTWQWVSPSIQVVGHASPYRPQAVASALN